MLLAKLHSLKTTDNEIACIQEESESDNEGETDKNRTEDLESNSSHSFENTSKPFRRKSSKTPPGIYSPPPVTPSKRYLKKVRTSSIIARQCSDCSIDTLDSDSSHSDSFFCNNANMPNKITGEMGLEILPTFLHCGGREEIMFRYTHDRHFQYIHPNVFAPACLLRVRRMGGGGSGVPVFSGLHPELGEIVMKHGSCSDLKELFALATISAELKQRGKRRKNDSSATAVSSEQAALDMVSCLPEFKMVYISPQQILFKQKAIWGRLRKLVRIGTSRTRSDSVQSLTMKIELSERHKQTSKSNETSDPSLVTLNDSKFLGPGASIRIYQCETAMRAKAYLEEERSLTNPRKKKDPSLAFVVPPDRIRSTHPTTISVDCSEDFNSLQHVYEDLSNLMSKHLFKFTLAQKRIGGKYAKTGSQWLYEGKLVGDILDNLITKFVRTVQDLQALTMPEEVDVMDQLREEVQKLENSDDGVLHTDELSAMADQFLGSAIKKNFHPAKGRIPFLAKTCNSFKSKTIFLMPEEELPAKHLAALVEPDALMSDIFLEATSEPPLISPNQELWMTVLAQATSDRPNMSPNATQRVWTSGLTDAGIHNLFVSQDDLYFFDLGVPKLESLPGFMTKFLFSFFHVLGMQEDDTSLDNEWVRRFNREGERLGLTPETVDLLEEAYDAFEVSLSRIIDDIFDGDQNLRWLLLQYVTLQLLSDASFCLQRWNLKGGGSPRDENHPDKGLEQWLWRALWDIYVAFDINTVESWKRLQVLHPDCHEDLHEEIGEQLLNSFEKSCNEFPEFSFDNDPEDVPEDENSMQRIEEGMEEKDGQQLPPKPRRSRSTIIASRQSLDSLPSQPRRSRSSFMTPRRSLEILSSMKSDFQESVLRQITTASFAINRSDITLSGDGISDDSDDLLSDEESERNRSDDFRLDLDSMFK